MHVGLDDDLRAFYFGRLRVYADERRLYRPLSGCVDTGAAARGPIKRAVTRAAAVPRRLDGWLVTDQTFPSRECHKGAMSRGSLVDEDR
ncbi:MAG: hypothetical protein ACR2JQ_12085, partial [Mycobacteriales bacterium]